MVADFVSFGIKAFTAEVEYQPTKPGAGNQNAHEGALSSFLLLTKSSDDRAITCLSFCGPLHGPISIELSECASRFF
jgi:hypothetical protein